MASIASKESTNVRIESPLDPWPARAAEPSRAPRWALVLWAAFVAFAGWESVFVRLEPEAYTALVAFAVAFIVLAAYVDRESRAIVRAHAHPLRWALAFDAAGLIASSRVAADGAWATWPGAFALLVLLPLALVLHAEAARRPRLRTAPGASPGANRAAT